MAVRDMGTGDGSAVRMSLTCVLGVPPVRCKGLIGIIPILGTALS